MPGLRLSGNRSYKLREYRQALYLMEVYTAKLERLKAELEAAGYVLNAQERIEEAYQRNVA